MPVYYNFSITFGLAVLVLLLSACDFSDSSLDFTGTELEDAVNEFMLMQDGSTITLGIQGSGYFILDDAGEAAYTRNSRFSLDDRGYLVDQQGRILQGNIADTEGEIIEGAAETLRVYPENAQLENLAVDEMGFLRFTRNEEQVVIGRLRLASFPAPTFLEEIDEGVWQATSASGVASQASPTTSGLGGIATDTESSVIDHHLLLTATDENYFVLQDDNRTYYAESIDLVINNVRKLVTPDQDVALSFFDNSVNQITVDSLEPIELVPGSLAPKETTEIELSLIINADNPSSQLPFERENPASYNYKVDVPFYDSLGNVQQLEIYIAQADLDYDIYYYHGDALLMATPLPNDLANGAAYTVGLITPIDSNGDANGALSGFIRVVDLIEQRSGQEDVTGVTVDGYGTAQDTLYSVDGQGFLTISYSNGVVVSLGQLALARFDNPEALVEEGIGLFSATEAAGEPIYGRVTDTGFGPISPDTIGPR